MCQHQLIRGYPTPKRPRVVENYVHSKSYTSPTRQRGTHFTGTSNVHVSRGAVARRIPVKGLQTNRAFLSCEPNGAEQAASTAPPPALTPCTQAPSSRGLDVSAEGGVARPWPSPPLMKCAEKMQHAGCLAGVQGEKKENSLWRDSVPTERARGDTSAHYRSLGRAILATAHNILGSGTLGVLRVGLLMDLLGVDGFNG